MTIVATADTRNAAWASDASSFGRKMLAKMGWKGGDSGLGKHQQGTSTHLRAVKRAESLGIGAESDNFGERGWADTNAGFHGVLASLKAEHGSGGGEDEAARKKRRKEEKRRKRREEKRRARANGGDGGNRSGGEGSGGARLPQNKVQAGHARKMREAKDIRNKSAEDMAAIFGVKADFYQQPREWVAGGGSSDDGKETADSAEFTKIEKKKKRSKKKSKENKAVDDGKASREKKKRRRLNEDDDSGNRKKSKKNKSKK